MLSLLSKIIRFWSPTNELFLNQIDSLKEKQMILKLGKGTELVNEFYLLKLIPEN
jgi:hypothetical protein